MDPRTDLAKSIIERCDELRGERATLDRHLDEVHRYVIPAVTPPTRNTNPTPGEKAHADIYDNTAESANEMLAAAINDGLTPDTIDWFSLRVTDDDALNSDQEVAAWLEDCATRMLNVFRSPRAGYAVAAHEMRTDLVTFGTGCLTVLDRPGEGVVFVAVPLRQVYLDADSEGRVAGVYRDYELKAKEALRDYPDAVGEAIRRAATSKIASERNRKFRFIQAVFPRTERDPAMARLDNRHKAFVDVIVSATDQRVVSEAGFDEMPFVTPRWSKRAGETYGRSQAMKALNDVKSLQRAAKINIVGGELAMRPPLAVANDGVMGPVRMTAGATHSVSADAMMGGNLPIRPILTGSRPDIGEELMKAMRERIENAFLKPLIQLIRKDRMTATEVLEVMEQNQRILSPFIGRLKSEDVGPTVERVFAIMQRAGRFAPMPRQLVDRDVGVEYVSPMVKKQRLAQARGLAQFLEITTPLAAIDGSIHDNLDVDRAYRDTADIMGLYKDWIRKSATVGEMRAARQQVQQAEAEHRTTVETAGAAANVVRAMPALTQALQSPTEAFDVAA